MKRLVSSLTILLLTCVFGLASAASSYEEGVAELSKSIVADAAKFKKQKLAVVDFTDLSGNVTELGRFLAEELSVSLVITGSGLEIVDRTQLNKILQEQALSFSGAIDPAAVKKVGQLAGVDALIAGAITDLRDTLRLTLKIIATDTGSLVSAARTTIPKTGTIANLMEREVTGQRVPSQGKSEVAGEPKAKEDTASKAPKTQTSPGADNLAELREDQPGWVIKGKNYNLVDSQLSSRGLFTADVGNAKWVNYAVEFDVKQLRAGWDHFGVTIRRLSNAKGFEGIALQINGEGEDFSRGRAGIAAKTQYAFGIPSQGLQRRRRPDAMPSRQHTR